MNDAMSVIKPISFASLLIAINIYAAEPQTPHTVHKVLVHNPDQWAVRITEIAPDQNAFFSLGQVASPVLDVKVSPRHPAQFGFGIKTGTDFNVAYTLAAIDTSASGDASRHKTRSCTFVISARAPASVDIQVINYAGARCSYSHQNARKATAFHGENFYLG